MLFDDLCPSLVFPCRGFGVNDGVYGSPDGVAIVIIGDGVNVEDVVGCQEGGGRECGWWWMLGLVGRDYWLVGGLLGLLLGWICKSL